MIFKIKYLIALLLLAVGIISLLFYQKNVDGFSKTISYSAKISIFKSKFDTLQNYSQHLEKSNEVNYNEDSFVDTIINNSLLFEENPNDEFLVEKKEINQLMAENKFNEAGEKFESLIDKEVDKYGMDYIELPLYKRMLKLESLAIDNTMNGVFPYDTGGYSKSELQEKLQDENTWKNFDEEVNKLSWSDFVKCRNYSVAFKIHRKVLNTCKEVLGEMNPVTLKRTMNLIQDYSILGDSTTAIKMAENLLLKVEKVFGKESDEAVTVIRLLANDYKILYDYQKSEELLKDALEINRKLHTEDSKEFLITANELELLWGVEKYSMLRGRLRKNKDRGEAKQFELSEKERVEYKGQRIVSLFSRAVPQPNYEAKVLVEILEGETKFAQKIYEPLYLDTVFEMSRLSKTLGFLSKSLNVDLGIFLICHSLLGDYHHKTITSMCNLSDDYLKLNDIDSALDLSLSAVNVSQKIYGEKHPCTINAVHTLTNIYRKLGKFNEALELDMKAYDIAKENFTNTIGMQAYTDWPLNNLPEENKKALDIRFESIDRQIKFYNDNNMPNEAKKLKLQAEELKRTVYAPNYIQNLSREEAMDLCYKLEILYYNEHTVISNIQKDIVDDYAGLKNHDYAINHAQYIVRNYTHLQRGSEPETLSTEINLAHFYNLSGNYEKTIKLFDADSENVSFGLMSKMNGIYLGEASYIVGDAFKNTGKSQKALEYYRKSIEGYEQMRDSYKDLTSEEKKQWFATVVPYYKEMASFFITQNAEDEAFKTVELCKARTLAEQYSELLAIYNSGLSDEDISKLNDYQKNISQYGEKIKESIRMGDDNLKFNLRYAQLKIMEEHLKYKEQIQEKYPKYKEMLNAKFLSEDIFSKEQLQQILPDNSCFIDFTLIKKSDKLNRKSDEILAFVVNKSGEVKGFNILIDDNFLEQCNLYRILLAYSDIKNMRADHKYLWKTADGNYKISSGRQAPEENAKIISSTQDLNNLRQDLSAKIGNVLFTPMKNFISEKSTWIISPDGELNSIPFETLQFNNKSVIEMSNISYVPSLAILKLMQEKNITNSQLKDRKEFFAMGDAVYGNYNLSTSRGSLIDLSQNIRSLNSPLETIDLTQIKWNNLPGTGKELDQVSTVFRNKEIFRGQDASETNLKFLNKSGDLSQYKYLLFATHGLFVPQRPELSSIVLSQGLDNFNDGYVTIGEWFDFNLNSDLVYLSACESGLGDYQAGEGIVGIPYALTVAGNKDTIMSLWKVDDEATAEFSAEFFKKLNQGKSEVIALNETKREFIAKHNSKFSESSVWAAFILYGF